MALPLLAIGKVGLPLVGSLISGGARTLQDVDKAAINAMYAAQDWRGLYNAMYDHQSGNADPEAMMWRTRAREYASQKFRQLQIDGVVIDQSQLYVRECVRIAEGWPCTVESGRARVVSRHEGPDYRAALPSAPPSTAESIVEALQAAADRGDAAAQAELATRLSLGTAQAAAEATAREQQASILGPLGAGNIGTVIAVVVLIGLVLAFTMHKG